MTVKEYRETKGKVLGVEEDIKIVTECIMKQLAAAYEYKESSRVCTDKRLKKVLAEYSLDEEKNAAMSLELLHEKEDKMDADSSPAPIN
jgi:hypothetical protein